MDILNYKTKVFKVQHKKSDTHLMITQNITPLTNWYIKEINTTKHCIINKNAININFI